MNSEIENVTSTDSVPIVGGINDFIQMYKDPIADGLIDGLEVVAVRRLVQHFLGEGPLHGLPVYNIHGRLEDVESIKRFADRPKMWLARSVMTSFQNLLPYAPTHDILLHSPDFKNLEYRRAILEHKDQIKRLWVEIHESGVGGMQESMEQVRFLQQNGVPAGFMIDWCHFIGLKRLVSEPMADLWKELINYFTKESEAFFRQTGDLPPFAIGSHLPVGTEKGDSIDLDIVDSAMMADLMDIIHELHIQRRTVENQQSGLRRHAVLFDYERHQIALRNAHIYERLVHDGYLVPHV